MIDDAGLRAQGHIKGLGFGVWGSGLRDKDLGFGV
jgi:hypothetical protein